LCPRAIVVVGRPACCEIAKAKASQCRVNKFSFHLLSLLAIVPPLSARRISVDYRPGQSGAGAREQGAELKTERQEDAAGGEGGRGGEGRSSGAEEGMARRGAAAAAAAARRERKRGGRTEAQKRGEGRIDEEDKFAARARARREKRNARKFSIKLRKNGGWLTRAAMDERGTARCADCNSNRATGCWPARVQSSAKVRRNRRGRIERPPMLGGNEL